MECEKEALTTINNQYVLQIYDIYQEKDYCYIITELCENGTLKDHIERKSIFLDRFRAFKRKISIRNISEDFTRI